MALKKYLLTNSSFSFFTGIMMLLINPQLSDFFNVSEPVIFTIIGVNLIIFSAFVFFVAQSKPLKSSLVKIIVLLDVLWVIGSLIIISTTIFDLTLYAKVSIGLVAVFIAFLAFKQYIHLQKVLSFKKNNLSVNS